MLGTVLEDRYRIDAPIELTQVSQAAHRQAMRVPLTGFEQSLDVGADLPARLLAGRSRAVRQQVISVHDAIDGGFHIIPS